MLMVDRWKRFALWSALVALVAACGGGGGTTTSGGSDTTAATTTTTAASGEKVQVRWFVGLGAGGQPEQIAAQERVVEQFNASHSNIELIFESVDNDVAYDTLATQLASGNPPDIIGPVGRDGSNSFTGQYLDLTPYIESFGVDLSRWPEATVENFREPDGTLPGLPFASFPSFMYFNKDLFDEAGLPYPPQEYGPDGVTTYGEGTEYEGTWDFDKVAELAKILTVDAKGNDATSASFDPNSTIQWGFVWQWTDRLFQQGAFWGAGNAMQSDNTARIPANWADEWVWYHGAIWNEGFAPSQTELDSELLSGNAFSSGNVGMAITHLWYTCCVRNDDGTGKTFFDLAVMPSHNGTVTALVHADTFRILKGSKNPEAAFEVLLYLLDDAALDLLNAYGAAPADESLTDAFFAGLDATFPQGVNWQVALDSAAYAESPSHEQYVPGWDEYKLRLGDFQSAMLSNPDLDMRAEIAKVEADLTRIFQASS